MAPKKKLLIADDSPLLARGIVSRTTRDEDILFGVGPARRLVDPRPISKTLQSAAPKILCRVTVRLKSVELWLR